ncbi:MAG TPA: GNAT family protein [Longimicrobium sp.]|nr:GNAT family protein [Longimicrobium sp.]
MQPPFRALRTGPLVLRLIEEEMLDALLAETARYPDAADLEHELRTSYLPEYGRDGRRTTYGFATEREGVLVGFSLLAVDSWEDARGSTGADTISAFRGQGIAPASKPALFHLGFAMLGLHSIATGCADSNASSRRSIEKTPGFVYERTSRESARREDGEGFEDEHHWSILRPDWERLYDPSAVEVLR